MKKTILLLAAIGMSTASFAQKDEIKAANKALKSGDAAAVLSALEGAASTIDAADAKYVNQYYFLQGEAMLFKRKQVIFLLMTKRLPLTPKLWKVKRLQEKQSTLQILSKSLLP